MGRVASGGCESACVCKQDGCGGVYERGGDTFGELSRRISIYLPEHDLADWKQALELESIRTHRWQVLRCSAMTGTNLKEGLAWVVEDAKKRLFLY
jgi:hypothetical protein